MVFADDSEAARNATLDHPVVEQRSEGSPELADGCLALVDGAAEGKAAADPRSRGLFRISARYVPPLRRRSEPGGVVGVSGSEGDPATGGVAR